MIGLIKESNTSNIMTITIESGISSDGCSIKITNNGKVVFREEYSYGYNASYNRR